jgi:hypothetical protein
MFKPASANPVVDFAIFISYGFPRTEIANKVKLCGYVRECAPRPVQMLRLVTKLLWRDISLTELVNDALYQGVMTWNFSARATVCRSGRFEFLQSLCRFLRS